MKLLLIPILTALAVHAATPLYSMPALDSGYRQMYNLQFADAHRTFADYARQNPNDPMGPVSDAAAYLFDEFDRLRILQSQFLTDDESFLDFRKPNADPKVKMQFEAKLAEGERLDQAALRKNPQDSNALFAAILRLGLHSNYLAMIEKRNLAALSEVKASRVYAEKLLALHPDFYDAYFAIGIENYLLSLKAAPMRWMLQATGARTDKQTGVSKLELTAGKGHLLAPYARLLLAVADLRDHAPGRAKERLEWLAKEYPQNRLYKEELARLK